MTSLSECCTLEESHPVRSILNCCIQKCRRLSHMSSLNPVTPSKQELLNKLQKQLQNGGTESSECMPQFQPGPSGLEESSSVRATQVFSGKSSLRRRNSKQPNFPVIVEAPECPEEPEPPPNTNKTRCSVAEFV